ncbi:MAG: putative metal-dependent hydrolase [Gemmatimonadetes bacterium]|nr:putative metal-dependent hydrolase [Gemmatimonadota bacterium]
METDLRFPTGKFSRPASFSAADRAAAIDAIADLPRALRDAVRGLSDAQLDTPYRPGGWTVRQLVHHVADSHVNAYIRLRLALTEDNPTIKPYLEAKWAELPDANSLPIDVSLGILDGIHTRWVALLRALPAADFARTMTHPENGQMSIDMLAALYAWHSRHHVAHVTGLRARSGW